MSARFETKLKQHVVDLFVRSCRPRLSIPRVFVAMTLAIKLNPLLFPNPLQDAYIIRNCMPTHFSCTHSAISFDGVIFYRYLYFVMAIAFDFNNT